MSEPDSNIGERVKRILGSKGLTLYQVSEKSRVLYGRYSPHFVPHNLYYGLKSESFTPSLQQLYSLSTISGYSFHDWLRVFGFRIDEIPRLQFLLHSKRTVILDSSVDDPEASIPWVRNSRENAFPSSIASIGALLSPAFPVRMKSIETSGQTNFLFAKIGQEDAFAFPNLIPGSLVRARCTSTDLYLPETGSNLEGLFLVQLQSGVCCSHVQSTGRNLVKLIAPQSNESSKEMRIGKDVRILGKLDLEIRRLVHPEQVDVSRLSTQWPSTDLPSRPRSLGQLLQQRRKDAGLSFREASEASHQVALALGEKHYFAAAGSLSDYEATSTPPRHIHKVIALCVIYAIRLEEFLKIVTLNAGESGADSIPDKLVPREFLSARAQPQRVGADLSGTRGFLGELLKRLGPLPFFLRKTWLELSGIRNLALNDFFWLPSESEPFHPLLQQAIVALVNRQKKKPIYFPHRPWWQQPMYLLLKRDGTYLVASCSLDDRVLEIREFVQHQWRTISLVNHDQAEVTGQIVGIARAL